MNVDYGTRRCAGCGEPKSSHVTGNAGMNAYCRPIVCEHADWPRKGPTFQQRAGDEWCHEHDDYAVNCEHDHDEDEERP